MRGSMRGIVTRGLDDGRIVIRPDGSSGETISLPENVILDE
jgi:hypothetical protein